MARMDDLVFHCHMSPREVEAMTPARLRWWHARAVKYFKKRNEG